MRQAGHIEETEVAVVGAGIMGASVAWRLAERGRKVVLLEQYDLGHTRGSSHGAARIFRLAYDDVNYVHLAREALTRWREVEGTLGVRVLEQTGGLDLGPPAELQPLATALDAEGVHYEVFGSSEVAARYPLYAIPVGWKVLYQEDGGVVYAGTAWAGSLEMAARRGARVMVNCPVTEVVPDGDGVVLFGSFGEMRASKAVITAAGWSNSLLVPLNLEVPMTVTREHLEYYRLPSGCQLLPSIWHDPNGSFKFYALPNAEEGIAKIGEHGAGPLTSPDQPATIDHERLQRIDRFAEAFLPAVVEHVRAETCLYASTETDDFVLDAFGPIVLGLGFGGHGFKFAPVVGLILADLVDEKRDPTFDRFAHPRHVGPSGRDKSAREF